MNKIYCCIYNESLGTWVAVSEQTHAHGKKSRGRLFKAILAVPLTLGLLLITPSALADIVIEQTTDQTAPIQTFSPSESIFITSSADLTVAGTAIVAASGAGAVSVTQSSTGTMSATENGVEAYAGNGDVTVSVAGKINAEVYGVIAYSAYGNASVSQAEGSTINTNNFDFAGYDYYSLGISAGSYEGDVAVDVAGKINAEDYGIIAYSTYGNVCVNQAESSTISSHDKDLDDDYSAGIYAGTYSGDIAVNVVGSIKSDGHAVQVDTATGHVTVNNTGTITSLNGNGIHLGHTWSTNTITNSGDITAAEGYAILGGHGTDDVLQTAGTLTGDIDLGHGDDTFTANGGAIVGGITAGWGSDIVTLNAPVDVSQLTDLEGDGGHHGHHHGESPEPFMLNQPEMDDIDTLNLGTDLTGSSNTWVTDGETGWWQPTVGEAGNVAINHWEQINVNNGATFSLSGMLETPELNIAEGSTLALADGIQSGVLTGDLNNFGTIDLHQNDANPVNTLTIEGAYTAGSDVIVDVNLATGQSDQLYITQTATGITHVIALNGLGDVIATDEMIQTPSVIVQDPSGGGTFVGSGATSNAGEGQLILGPTDGETSAQNYIWTLNALDTGLPIYKAEVSGYTQMPYANLLLGYEMLGTLHDRIGEQQTWAWDKCGTCQETQSKQIWARIRGNNTELTGEKRLDMEADQFVGQIGYDFDVRYNPDKGSRRHTGVMASYGHSNIDFFDRYRTDNALLVTDKFTGEGTTDAGSLGLYRTYYDKNGSYLDLVGQVSFLQNEYKARSGRKVDQNGWGAGISAEVGRPYQIGNSHWLIEPQAQLSYQFVSLEDFNDGSTHVNQDDQHGLRGRLGARLAYNVPTADYRTKTFYMVANVLSDFIEPADVSIGRDVLNEDYSRTWGEVGLGMQYPIAKSAYLYADARYQQELTGEDRNGYTGSIGIKHSW